MTDFEEEFRTHLDKFATAPFLFVGSGFSRRYTGSDDWKSLLEKLSKPTQKPYARYSSSASGNLPRVASLIAEDFHDIWWDHEDYADSRAAFPSPLSRESPLKIEVAARFLNLVDRLPDEGELNAELEALRDAVIEGIITTNFDTILEYVFPDFATYVGQDELLFRDPYGVAEIYKIHGSATQPESIVITEADFDEFSRRNVYLAAKLLTVFVEHPVIFIGYSLTDENVQEIINSIASILTNKNLDQLKDRLIFVDWDEKVASPTMVASNFSIGTTAIPIRLVKVSGFLDVFQVLSTLKRRFPARILRHLKEQVYDLVRTSEPGNAVVVSDLEADTDVQQVDVVIGVGVTQRLTSQGVVGISRRDLVFDVLTPKFPRNNYAEIVSKVLPTLAAGRTHLPIYLYLRGAGLLDDDGNVKDAGVAASIRARTRLGVTPLHYNGSYYKNKTAKLIEANPTLDALIANVPVKDALLAIPSLDERAVDPTALRDYLLANAGLFDSGNSYDSTNWARCVRFYDYVANRKKPSRSGRRTSRRSGSRATRTRQ